jgi:hypothetical protein
MHKDAKYDLVPDYSLWYGNEEDTAVSAVCDGQWWVFLKINNDSEVRKLYHQLIHVLT